MCNDQRRTNTSTPSASRNIGDEERRSSAGTSAPSLTGGNAGDLVGDTIDVLHKFPHDYKVIFVGDATMSPYEITYPGGSVEHWNEEAGAVWLDRVTQIYPSTVWLNPTAERHWDYTPSVGVMKQLVSDRMYPLTIEGLDKAMRELVRG